MKKKDKVANKLTVAKAFKIDQEIKQLKVRVNSGFLDLARLLKDIKDDKLYESLGYETFESYIAQPELGFDRSSVYRFIQIYDKFVIELGVAPGRLVLTDWTKLRTILPCVNKSNVKELLAKAESLSRSDLRLEILEERVKLLPPVDDAKFKNQVIHGDCIKEMKKLDDNSVDMVYIDPPYNVSKDKWDEFTSTEFLRFTKEYVRECLRLLKDKSHLFIQFPSQKVAWLENLLEQEFGIIPASRIVWHYRNLVKGRDAKDKFLSTYQPILHYNIGDKELNFSPDWSDERFDVWTIASPQSNFKEGKYHITQKPLELLERLVSFGSKPGELILDPMAGSGTTGIASLKHQRDFILIEQEASYIEAIHRRLHELE